MMRFGARNVRIDAALYKPVSLKSVNGRSSIEECYESAANPWGGQAPILGIGIRLFPGPPQET